MKFSTALLVRAALTASLIWFLALPLADIVRYPDRLSVVPNLQVDAAEYDNVARAITATWRWDLPLKIQPGWVTFLAAAYSVTGPSYVAGKLVSWTALVVSVALCAWLARRVYGSGAAWVAALLCASSPALRGYTGTLQYEVTSGALALGLVAVGLWARDAATRDQLLRRTALAGVIAAVLVLTREPFALAVPMLGIWVAQGARARVGIRPAVFGAVLLVATAALPAIAWSARQTIREGHLILISEKGSKELEYGNNPRANGTFNEPLVGVGEPAGFAFMRQFPGRTSELAVRKVLYFWGVLRDGWTVPQPANVWIWRATTGAVPLTAIAPIVRGGWLLVACAAAFWVLRADGVRRWWILPAIVGAVMALHIVTVSSYRFAVSVLPIAYVVASGPIARVAHTVGRSLRAPIVAGAAALLLALAITLQFQHPRFDLGYRAVDLEGAQADNGLDSASGRPARIADARRGARVVAMLSDEYLPGGEVVLTVRARRLTGSAESSRAAAHASLTELTGRTACTLDITVEQLPLERFAEFPVSCWLSTTGPTTVAIATLGVVDLSLDQVRLNWTGVP